MDGKKNYTKNYSLKCKCFKYWTRLKNECNTTTIENSKIRGTSLN